MKAQLCLSGFMRPWNPKPESQTVGLHQTSGMQPGVTAPASVDLVLCVWVLRVPCVMGIKASSQCEEFSLICAHPPRGSSTCDHQLLRPGAQNRAQYPVSPQGMKHGINT
jgi:hypothetical protein